jgi:hypothetical protein
MAIAAANQQRIDRMCNDPSAAYETGYNMGVDGRRLDTSWADSCAPQMAQQVRASYQAGFQAGAQRAPTRAVITVATPCSSGTDCPTGQICDFTQNVCR